MLLLDLYGALRPLDEITGVTTSDDILNLIFSTFCIGKSGGVQGASRCKSDEYIVMHTYRALSSYLSRSHLCDYWNC